MKVEALNHFVLGNKVAKLPIVQGGMGIGISMSGLASAVANEGGIGVISAAGVGLFDHQNKQDKDRYVIALKAEIRKTRQLTNGIIGVNILVALSNFHELAKAAIEEGIDIIFAGAGLPLDLPSLLDQDSSTKLIPIISSGRAAKLIIQKWVSKYGYIPDGFVLEGPKAGGHLGFKKDQIDDEEYDLEKLLPQVLEAVKPFEEMYSKKIPIIVGGGIYTGEDIYYFMSHGASAVQMATRFVTTEECDASLEFKQAYINAEREDIVIIDSPVGLPGRAVKNPFLEEVYNGLRHPFSCPFNCISTCKKEQAPYCISLALYNAKKGKMNNGFAFAGTNAYLAKAIVSVKDLISSLKQEYLDAFRKKLSPTL
ncbi:MAG: nitronate monooxygenase [Firmicutes bacterium]|nr:nitronate monooxygenase [Bacillota bacterium]